MGGQLYTTTAMILSIRCKSNGKHLEIRPGIFKNKDSMTIADSQTDNIGLLHQSEILYMQTFIYTLYN
jgi:hypothetical protein